MVSETLKLKELISWHLMYDVEVEGKDVFIYYYSNPATLLKIKLDDASVKALAQKRDTIINFLEQSITLSGTVVEKLELQKRQETKEIEEWVRVQP